MKTGNNNHLENVTPTKRKFLTSFSLVPLLGWLLGALIAVVIERYVGLQFAWTLKLPKIPALFGFLLMIKTPQLIPSVLLYVIVIYVLPISIVARLSASLANKLTAKLITFPLVISTVIHLSILYATLHLWAGVSDYRLLVLKLILIAIMLTLSLNIINGYMGEFSCSHPGFMAIGAYVASVFTLALFINGGFFETRYRFTSEAFEQLRSNDVQEEVLEDLQVLQDQTIVGKEEFLEVIEGHIGAKHTAKYRRALLKQTFASPFLPEALGPILFPIGLILGGLVASVGALAVAIPSFRTRGDYLAIISLAFMFIVKSLIENLEVVGGPRGLGGQPDYATLPVVFLWTVACIWVINNFVRSTMGKALNAVRDNYMAADAMTVNSRHTKFMAFLFAAFWAGVAGGLFAHVIRYVNPGTFDIKKLAEVLAMVYFGGLNSTYGSIVGAVSISLLGEALRPLEIFKWIIIPLLLILVIIYRPTGLIAFKELRIEDLLKPKTKTENEV
jgi:ABC-type branched-subunit amino acid transport system permease subunit